LDSLQQHRDYLEAEWQDLLAAPLSARKARLVAALVDAYVDRMFAATRDEDDILEFRAAVAGRSVALGRVMALCSQQAGMRLATEAVKVPIAEYGTLGVEDFMVSLYNDYSVQRLLLVLPDGQRFAMLDVLREAIKGLKVAASRVNGAKGGRPRKTGQS
jgi:hypothetical protein